MKGLEEKTCKLCPGLANDSAAVLRQEQGSSGFQLSFSAVRTYPPSYRHNLDSSFLSQDHSPRLPAPSPIHHCCRVKSDTLLHAAPTLQGQLGTGSSLSLPELTF